MITNVDVKKPTLLIGDHEPHVVNMIRLLFGDTFDIYRAYSGIQTILLAKQIKPDVVLVDADMPKFSGYRVSAYLKKHDLTKDIPVLLIVPRMSEVELAKYIKSNASDYITKPFDVHKLERRLKRLLHSDMSYVKHTHFTDNAHAKIH